MRGEPSLTDAPVDGLQNLSVHLRKPLATLKYFPKNHADLQHWSVFSSWGTIVGRNEDSLAERATWRISG